MQKKLLSAITSLAFSSMLLATDTLSQEDAHMSTAVRKETYEEYSARLLRESNTPEAMAARERMHRIHMRDDPIYRRNYEESERIRRGEPLQH